MLQIKSHSKIDFPYTIHGSAQKKFAFSPITSEPDSLIKEIDDEEQNQWDLNDQPAEELEEFWDTVANEVRQDPTWQFSNDD